MEKSLSRISQQQVVVKPLPYPFQWERLWPEGSVALLTDDGTPASVLLAQALISRSMQVMMLRLPGTAARNIEMPEKLRILQLESTGREAIQQALQQAQQLGPVELFIYMHAAGGAASDATQAVFWIAGELQAIFHKQVSRRCSFLNVTRINGAFGYGAGTTFDWQTAGLTGLVKSLNREWPSVFCRSIDLHPALTPQQLVECLLTELQDTDLALAETGYDAALNRQTLSTQPAEATLTAAPAAGFQPSDVVLVTGGARGITAHCIIELARACPCTFLLLGRSNYEAEDPEWAEGITEEKALKQAIFQLLQREGEKPRPMKLQEVYQQIMYSRNIRSTLEAIQAAGAKADYVRVNIMDAEASRHEILAIQRKWGKVTGIVHGAGVLADKLVEKKTEADLANVYGTKIQGLLHVLSAVEAAALKNIILFGSVSGFYGNEGQTDYSLANDTLNKWALSYQHQHPQTRVLSINWGPWNTGMITPYIQQEFKNRGVMLIQESEGVAHFIHLLQQPGADVVTIVNNHMPPPPKCFQLGNQMLSIKKRLKPEENPFLKDHVIAGHPVMPFVSGIAWIANAAEQLFPTYHLLQCEQSKLFNGIIFNGKQAIDYFLDLEVVQQDKQYIRLKGKVWSFDGQERRRYHYGSEILLTAALPEQPLMELPTFGSLPLKTREVLYTEGCLFHGPAYQGMEALWHMDEQQLWYTCRLPEPNYKTQGEFPLQTSNTFATDAMCQGFLVWAFHYLKASCLPAGMGNFRIYEPLPFNKTFWVHLSITGQTSHKVVGNATAISPEGKVLVEARDIALTVSEELLSLYQTQDISKHPMAVVDMDVRLPGIPDLDAFYKALYDGTFSADFPKAIPGNTPAVQSGLYQQMYYKAGVGKPLAVISIGDQKLAPEDAPEIKETFTAFSLTDALATANKWLQQNPEGSVLLGAQHLPAQCGAGIRLMLSSEATKTKQPVYAVLNKPEPFISASLEALMPVLNYLDVDPAVAPPKLSLAGSSQQNDPVCALGTLVLPDAALQELARLIKLCLCLHYRFLPALREPKSLPQLSRWDAQLFYAPEDSFPWIPENNEEKRVAALVLKVAEAAVILKLEEASPAAEKSRTYLRQQDKKLLLVSGNSLSELMAKLENLEKEAVHFSHKWAAAQYRQNQARPGKYTISLIAGSQRQLVREIAFARNGLEAAFTSDKTWQTPAGSYFSAKPLGKRAKIGFIYPGLASAYAGMFKDNIQLFPDYFSHYDAKIDKLHELVHQPLMRPRYLQRPDPAERKAREAAFLNNTVAASESSISMSVFATQVLRNEFELEPEAALGYSMGGITMFFALDVWGFRHLRSRVRQSPVFQANTAFKNWAHWVLIAPAEKVKEQIAGTENLYLTFINTPGNVIISGDRTTGEAWLQQHQYVGIVVDLYNVAHCPPIKTMYHQSLREMHLLDIEQTPGIRFYSGPRLEPMPLDKETLAMNAADTYCQPVDFVAQVQKAYQDGINVFIEVGPKAWCSRLVSDILQDEPHISLGINQKGVSDYRSLLQLSSVLCSHGIPIRLPFYEESTTTPAAEVTETAASATNNVALTVAAPPVGESVKQEQSLPKTATEKLLPLKEAGSLLQATQHSCYLFQDRESNHYLSAGNSQNRQYQTVGILPALPPEKLGSAAFREMHKLRYAYMAGAMANGIASEEMVIALGEQGMLGSFGAAGLGLEKVEKAINTIQEALPHGPYAFNLIHSLGDGALEMRLVELYLQYRVRTLEASAFMEITPALVYYRAAGLVKDKDCNIRALNKIIAKVSRAEVARLFMQPAPDALLKVLVLQDKISPEQMEWAKQLPLAGDITVEADSGGHTDNQALVCALPEMIRLKERIEKQYAYAAPLHIGAAGGISTPASVVAAFAMGADYVVTGSINQACREAATSAPVKAMLAKASSADVVLAPSADMFEMGISVQVLKRSTMYASRAKKLYQLYSQYEAVTDIPTAELEKLEKQLFQMPLNEVWNEVEKFFRHQDPLRLETARQHPKRKMALIFRWYLGLSSKWAVKGVEGRTMDYQVWCGPAMGAFNDWVKGSAMEALENRTVAAVAMRLLREAAVLHRIQLLKMYGVNTADTLKINADTEMMLHA
ncbi:PfaD family polyunsaturated fatty acid/polyketide biosynthesis protein [Cesiribacter sp. SM1]|uniref:PfaD family polyunsaturated fatty acid/polyketide biosynthesis protein n=1 Tax=Cesiribacter sp. SM1 TaxID=2861196 RepID=UPI001CD3E26C|nr:PfaD family polyunsaturated fatty acid/polyketide biosynthesis protein [Cesiribacter sp. SM1]